MIEAGVPAELAKRVSALLDSFGLLDITEVAELAEHDAGLDSERSPQETAELYYALSEHLDIDLLLTSISGLERGNRWHALARLALRDDLYGSLRAITLDVLRQSDPGDPAETKIAAWEDTNASRLSRARAS
ncbi:MAG: NAD-glutamate dehydrogenase, partial [Actinomycetota bacterium]|nr:NAD-glutamate dehydrogenase [Actinomycetota bacterium]